MRPLRSTSSVAFNVRDEAQSGRLSAPSCTSLACGSCRCRGSSRHVLELAQHVAILGGIESPAVLREAAQRSVAIRREVRPRPKAVGPQHDKPTRQQAGHGGRDLRLPGQRPAPPGAQPYAIASRRSCPKRTMNARRISARSAAVRTRGSASAMPCWVARHAAPDRGAQQLPGSSVDLHDHHRAAELGGEATGQPPFIGLKPAPFMVHWSMPPHRRRAISASVMSLGCFGVIHASAGCAFM